jgi:hypothetical protein
MEDDPARQQFRAGLAVEEELVPVCGEIVQGADSFVKRKFLRTSRCFL